MEILFINLMKISLDFDKSGKKANTKWIGLGRNAAHKSEHTLIDDAPLYSVWSGAIGAIKWSETENGVIHGPKGHRVSKVVLSAFRKETNGKN